METTKTLTYFSLLLTTAACYSANPEAKSADDAMAADDQMSKEAEEPAAAEDIVAVAIGAGQFKTLVAALEAAGLVETLQGPGPFTVFAPTDEAFAKLPAGTVEDLLKPENKEKLVAVLTYHVVSGKVMAKDVVTMDSAKTVQGGMLKVTANDDGVSINNAKVIKTDIPSSNGVIHVIDTVVLPG